MKKYPKDASCAKLLKTKSSGHLKIALIIFLISIIITNTIGLLYAKQYFQYEKDFLHNVAISTVTVSKNHENGRSIPVKGADVDKISQALKNKFPDKKFDVIPVYSLPSGVFMNSDPINIFALEKEQAFLAGINEASDNTAYFLNGSSGTITMDICVTKIVDNGFESGELKRMTLKSETGVSKKTPVLTNQNGGMTPRMMEDPICFVNMKTFCDIASNLLDKEVKNISEVAENSFVSTNGIYVFCEDVTIVSDISTFLNGNNYGAYAPTDAFDDFSETVSVTFLVFLLSSIALIFMTTINIILSFRSFYRVQQKDMGVLRYMGFNDKRIYRMYRRNLFKTFLQIISVSSLFVLILGMILFSFNHWLVLASFILALFAFLCIIFFTVSRFIVYRYVKQDFLALIRESKEFE